MEGKLQYRMDRVDDSVSLLARIDSPPKRVRLALDGIGKVHPGHGSAGLEDMAVDAGEPQYGHSQLERMTVEELECSEDLSSSLAIAPRPMTSCAELMRTNDPINMQLTPLHDDDAASVSYIGRRPSNEDDEAIPRRDPLLHHVLA